MKWYQNKWLYYGIALITIIGLYFLLRNTVNQTNLAKYLKQQNDDFRIELKMKDRIIDSLIVQKNKIRVVRDKVSTKAEEELIAKLQKELAELRSKQVTVDTLTPERLNQYFQNLLTK
jgi:phosphopantothenoylcysteine synthetase/decarboxylase